MRDVTHIKLKQAALPVGAVVVGVSDECAIGCALRVRRLRRNSLQASPRRHGDVVKGLVIQWPYAHQKFVGMRTIKMTLPIEPARANHDGTEAARQGAKEGPGSVIIRVD